MPLDDDGFNIQSDQAITAAEIDAATTSAATAGLQVTAATTRTLSWVQNLDHVHRARGQLPDGPPSTSPSHSPVLQLAALAIGLPLDPCLTGWLLAGPEPASFARRTLTDSPPPVARAEDSAVHQVVDHGHAAAEGDDIGCVADELERRRLI